MKGRALSSFGRWRVEERTETAMEIKMVMEMETAAKRIGMKRK